MFPTLLFHIMLQLVSREKGFCSEVIMLYLYSGSLLEQAVSTACQSSCNVMCYYYLGCQKQKKRSIFDSNFFFLF